jgi:hypothetical protein
MNGIMLTGTLRKMSIKLQIDVTALSFNLGVNPTLLIVDRISRMTTE